MLATSGKLQSTDEISEDKSSWLTAEQYFPEQFDQVLTALSRKPADPPASDMPSAEASIALAPETAVLAGGQSVPLQGSPSQEQPQATELPSGRPGDIPELPPPPPRPSVIRDICHLVGALCGLKKHLPALSERLGSVSCLVSLYSLAAIIGPLLLFRSCHPALKNELQAGCIGLIVTVASMVCSFIMPRFCPDRDGKNRTASVVVSLCLQMNTASLLGAFFSLQHGLSHPQIVARGVTLAVLLLINACIAVSSYQMLSTYVNRLLKQTTCRCLLIFGSWQFILYLAFSAVNTYYL